MKKGNLKSKKRNDQDDDEEEDILEELLLEDQATKNLKKRAILMLSGPVQAHHLGICHELLSYHFDPDFNDTITLLINSPGGNCDIGWAIIDTMNFIKHPIQTVCIGLAASMAADIFVNGDVRVMGSHATLMVHSHSGLNGGSHHKLVATMKGDEIEYQRRLQHYLDNSKYIDRDKVENTFLKIPGDDLYLSPAECITHGIADGIAADTKEKKRNKETGIAATVVGQIGRNSTKSRSSTGSISRGSQAARGKNRNNK